MALLPASDVPADVLCQGLQGAVELDSDSEQAPLSSQLSLLGTLGCWTPSRYPTESCLTPCLPRQASAHPNPPPSGECSASPGIFSKNALNYFFGYPGSAQGAICSHHPSLLSTLCPNSLGHLPGRQCCQFAYQHRRHFHSIFLPHWG